MIQKTIRSALFVDFDNIYISLDNNVGKETADYFAHYPDQWIKWLETNPDSFYSKQAVERRSILIRHCYLNPASFSSKRSFFVNGGFTVVDCPPVTSHGKTSTDIHMVMDILDTLNQLTHIEEFILFSADSDFRPVALRLRSHDRRTTVLSVGPISQAYIGSVDVLIDQEDFIEKALKMETSGLVSKDSTVSQDVLRQMANTIYEQASSDGEIAAAEIPHILRYRYDEFTPDSNWLGFGTLSRMVQNIIRLRDDLQLSEDETKSSWSVTVRDNRRTAVDSNDSASLGDKIFHFVEKMVRESPDPVTMAEAAQRVRKEIGEQVIESCWLGFGTFKNLLRRFTSPHVAVFVEPSSPGYLYDPERHKKPTTRGSYNPSIKFERQHPELFAFARTISNVTGAPLLDPHDYSRIFELLANDINTNGYVLTRATLNVRDRLLEEDIHIARNNIGFILKGIVYTGYRFGETEERATSEMLAQYHYRNILNLCENSRFTLHEEDKDNLKEWFFGKVDDD